MLGVFGATVMTMLKSVRPSISKALILTDDDFRLWCMVGGKCLSLLSDHVVDRSWVFGDVACMWCRVALSVLGGCVGLFWNVLFLSLFEMIRSSRACSRKKYNIMV